MAAFNRETMIRQLRSYSTEKLAEILRKRDTSERREEIFSIIENLLAERLAGHQRVTATSKAAAKSPTPIEKPTHASTRSFEEKTPEAIAIHCSSGRFSTHFDEFLTKTLDLPRCHRLAVPGGPVLLAGRLASYWEGSGVENQARFMIETNSAKRVILIAHEGCAYYSCKLGLADVDVFRAQKEDLVKAAQAIQRLGDGLDVKAYVARLEANQVVFEHVTLD